MCTSGDLVSGACMHACLGACSLNYNEPCLRTFANLANKDVYLCFMWKMRKCNFLFHRYIHVQYVRTYVFNTVVHVCILFFKTC